MKKNETITLIWFRNRLGKTHTVEISMKAVIIAISMVVLLLTLSISLSVGFYIRDSELGGEIRALNEEVKALKEERPSVATPHGMEESPSGLKAGDIAIDRKEKPADGGSQGSAGKKMSIEKVTVVEQEDRKGVTLYFEVAAKEGNEGKLSGLVVIAGASDGNYFTVPQGIEVKDGTPVDYKKGERFTIRYRKKFEKVIPYPQDSLSAIEVFVYGDKGELLLRQGVKIK